MAPPPGLLTIRSEGIYHGLPTLPDTASGLTAIVTGANGISGTYMLRVLCKDPTRWKKIFALSRRPPHLDLPPHVEHVRLDLLQDPAEISRQLKEGGIRADYVFFFAYIQPKPVERASLWSATDDLVKVNKKLLDNFLKGLAGASAIPKRILLQLGAKYYGVHLGPTTVPQEESDPRVLLEPNFYYDQEEVLEPFCAEHGCEWNKIRPAWIPGAAPDAAMNLAYPLLVYGLVQQHLGKPLVFPSDLASWENLQIFSSAMMNGYLAEWAVLTDDAKNESLNATDDSPFSWGKFWPKYAAHLGIPWEGPDVSPEAQFHETFTPYRPPPRGWGPPGRRRFKFTFAEWAKQDDVAGAWKDIARKAGCASTELGDDDAINRIFGVLDSAISVTWDTTYSNTKIRKLGWFGFVDATETLFSVFDEFADMKMAPRITS